MGKGKIKSSNFHFFFNLHPLKSQTNYEKLLVTSLMFTSELNKSMEIYQQCSNMYFQLMCHNDTLDVSL